MYDENLSILEESDYDADSFWLEEEELSYTKDDDDDFLFEIDEEMNLISIERTIDVIKDLVDKVSLEHEDLHKIAKKTIKDINDFINKYEKVSGLDF